MSAGAGGDVRISPAGDAALLLEFTPLIDPAINARAIALAQEIERRCGSAVRDAVVGYCSVTVYFDPLLVDGAWLESEMRTALDEIDGSLTPEPTPVDVPVCYDPEFGPDLADVAAFGGVSIEEVVRLHLERVYRVYVIGFVPGFTYMAEVDPRIAAPRRATPRTQVVPGSVAIAGGQTGIYPSATPGGWNIIGRTPLRPYDPARPQPFAFRPGDAVRFRPVSRDEFESLDAASAEAPSGDAPAVAAQSQDL
jgi:inhibitor of KinA